MPDFLFLTLDSLTPTASGLASCCLSGLPGKKSEFYVKGQCNNPNYTRGNAQGQYAAGPPPGLSVPEGDPKYSPIVLFQNIGLRRSSKAVSAAQQIGYEVFVAGKPIGLPAAPGAIDRIVDRSLEARQDSKGHVV